MSSRARTVLGVLLALFLFSGTALFTATGIEGIAGIDLPFLNVRHADEVPETGFNESEDWVMRNSTRVSLREDWIARQDNASLPTSYCLRTRRRFGEDRLEVYGAIPQRFQNRSHNGTVTDEICPGTHPVILRPRPLGMCSMTRRDIWMLGHIGMDASIIQCGPDRFVIYTDDDFVGKRLPILSSNASSPIPPGAIPVTIG